MTKYLTTLHKYSYSCTHDKVLNYTVQVLILVYS